MCSRTSQAMTTRERTLLAGVVDRSEASRPQGIFFGGGNANIDAIDFVHGRRVGGHRQ
jgi:hypothetical protein